MPADVSGPPVLLLHGSGPGTTAAAWDPLAAALAPRYRVIAPDLLGFGASPRPAGSLRAAWTRQALDLLARRLVDQRAELGALREALGDGHGGHRLRQPARELLGERIETGMVGLNRGVVSDPAAPFGGTKQSGLGREGGHHGLLEFLEPKYFAFD